MPIIEALELRLACSGVPDSEGFVPLFERNSTEGWVVPYSTGRARVKGGVVRLTGDGPFFLVSKATYKDFILEGEARIPLEGNSGIQFHSRYSRNSVRGYQADIDTMPRNWSGGIWSQARGWIARPKHAAPVRPGRWNHYRVQVEGDLARVFVNGRPTVTARIDSVSDGHLALQNHGGGGIYQFRNFRIKIL